MLFFQEVVSLKFGDLVSTCPHVVQTHQYSHTQLHNSKHQAPAQVQRCSMEAEIAALLAKDTLEPVPTADMKFLQPLQPYSLSSPPPESAVT